MPGRNWIALLAWVALALPWQHCRAECHDRLELVPATEECHAGCEDSQPEHGCGQDCADEHAPGHESSDADHETIRFVSLDAGVTQSAATPPIAELALPRAAQLPHALRCSERTPSNGVPTYLHTCTLLL